MVAKVAAILWPDVDLEDEAKRLDEPMLGYTRLNSREGAKGENCIGIYVDYANDEEEVRQWITFELDEDPAVIARRLLLLS
jgi:hypothetical protein